MGTLDQIPGSNSGSNSTGIVTTNALLPDAANQTGMVLDGIPRNADDLIKMGHRRVLLDIEVNGGKVEAWLIKDGTLWTIRCNGTHANLLSYGLSEKQAIENMEEIFRRMLKSKSLQISAK